MKCHLNDVPQDSRTLYARSGIVWWLILMKLLQIKNVHQDWKNEIE